MCGRYASARSVDDIAEAFGIASDDVATPVAPDWNIAPTKQVPVVVVRDERRALTLMRWGLVPAWAEDPSIGARLINARIETVADKPAFREALLRRRCLLPADGWYEWRQLPGQPGQPYFIGAADGSLIGFAGLWETWHDASGMAVVSTTILTGPAPPSLAHLHGRAPIVLPRDRWSRWLQPGPDGAHAGLTVPMDRLEFAARAVGPAVGDVTANGPELLAPFVPPEQTALF